MLTRKRKDLERKQDAIESPSEKRPRTESAMTQSPAVTGTSRFGVTPYGVQKSSSDLKAETSTRTSTKEQSKKEPERIHEQLPSSSQSLAVTGTSRFGVKPYGFQKDSNDLRTETPTHISTKEQSKKEPERIHEQLPSSSQSPAVTGTSRFGVTPYGVQKSSSDLKAEIPTRTSTKKQPDTIQPTFFVRLDDFTEQYGRYQDFFPQEEEFENDTFNEGKSRAEIPDHHTTILNTMTENMSEDFESDEFSRSKVVGISDYTSQTGRQICLITISGKSYNPNSSDPGPFLYAKLNDNIEKLNRDDTTREYRYVFDISEKAQSEIRTIKSHHEAVPNRFCAEDKTTSELLKFKFGNLSGKELKVDISIPIKTNYYQVDAKGNYERVPSCGNCKRTREAYHQRTEPFNDTPPHSKSTYDGSMFTFWDGAKQDATATSSSSCSSEYSERGVVIKSSPSRG